METHVGHVLVTAKLGGYVLCMIDDSGTDAVLLKAQLYLIFRLLLLLFGPNALKTKQSPFFLRFKKQVQRVVDLASHFAANEQSFLCTALEQLDVNKELLKHVRAELNKVWLKKKGEKKVLFSLFFFLFVGRF